MEPIKQAPGHKVHFAKLSPSRTGLRPHISVTATGSRWRVLVPAEQSTHAETDYARDTVPGRWGAREDLGAPFVESTE